MELCIEELCFKRVATISTVSIDMHLGSIKGFIFEPIEKRPKVKGHISTISSDLQQVLFVSGPEPKPVDNEKSTSKG